MLKLVGVNEFTVLEVLDTQETQDILLQITDPETKQRLFVILSPVQQEMLIVHLNKLIEERKCSS